MMGAERVFENLSLREKTAIMAVLSRDRQLREAEDERVTKLRIDLAQERRQGALVAGRDRVQKKRTCARCRGQIGLLESERCPVCKHVICKKCRVSRSHYFGVGVNEKISEHRGKRENEVAIEDKSSLSKGIPSSLKKLERVSSYPSELNPFEKTSIEPTNPFEQSNDVDSPSTALPRIECEVVGDDVPLTSTPDPNLGRSLVGGDTRNMSLSPNHGENYFRQHLDVRRYSDVSHLRRKRLSFKRSSLVGASLGDSSKVKEQREKARRKLYDSPDLQGSRQHSTGLLSLLSTAGDDSDGPHVHSDSSAYMTASVSTPPKSYAEDDENSTTLGVRSSSTGYLPDFDEREAVAFLLEIGARRKTKPTEDSSTGANDVTPSNDVTKSTSHGPVNHKSGGNEASYKVPARQETADKPKPANLTSIFSSTFDNIAKNLRNRDGVSSNKEVKKNTIASLFGISRGPTSGDGFSQFKDLILLNAPNPSQPKSPKESAAKLFQMASNPRRDPAKSNAKKLNQTGEKTSVEGHQEELKESETILQVEGRLFHSNPNSPYRPKTEALSSGKNGRVACLSEHSAPSGDELYYPKESSSSDAPSTSSSGEYRYYSRRRQQTSTKANPAKNEYKRTEVTLIKDSGYNTRENYKQAKSRSKYIRTTRMSRRARERERGLRRLGRRSIKGRPTRSMSSRKESSSDLSDSDKPKPVAHRQQTEKTSVNTNCMAGSKPNIQGNFPELNSPPTETTPVEKTGDFNMKTKRPQTLLQSITLKIKPSNKSDYVGWVCRVCDKVLDVKKKSGDWFYVHTRPEVLHFKELLLNTKRRLSGDAPVIPLRMIERLHPQPSPLTFDPSPSPKVEQKSLLHPSLTRTRSNTLPCDLNEMSAAHSSGSLHKSPSSTSLADYSVDMSQMAANLQRQRLRIGRRSIAEVLHGTLLYHVPDPKSDTARPIFVKKQSSVTDPAIPACVRDGPQDCTVLRGNPVSLCCALGGTPPLKSVWRKGKNEIKSSKQCCIDLTNTSAALTIKRSEKDDSGCYTLQVKNSGGVDQYSINVSIVDVPDPPGKPYASDIAGSSLVLSWYGTGYDGGSSVTGYRVEVAEVTSSTKPLRWSAAASTKSTTCTVKDLTPNSKYIFRVCAENKYGTSSPGQQSDVVLNTVTEVVDSSEDEEAFVKHGAVSIKTDGTFSQTYETKERLGQGRFGKVHRVVNRHTGKEYAAKIMRALKAKDKEAVQQEIDIMNSLRHPRLVQLIDAYSHGREITMVMDLVSGGELFERVIDEDFELTEAACIKYMSQICDGLQYMHDTLILHLDLKPENIMCINKTGTQIKIIDFGLARRYNPKEVIRVMFGTPEFVAPEVINYDAIGPQTDMWSVGVICYILLSGLSPFMGDNDTETLSNITAAEWDFDDESFDDISHEAKDFIRQLLVKNLDKRYTVKKALEHKWLKKDTNKMKKSKLNTKNLKRFLARRKWQKTGNAVRALGRLASLANLGSTQSNPNKISNGQPRESGFLAALKAQLLRENEEEQESHDNCKPMFETLFDDVEVIEGSAAKFECTIIGTPDPEIMWFKDGEPIKESRRFKISYTEDDVCTLLITDATEADEAEYSCKAVNCEGETEHRAELIVITPGV